MEAKKKLLDIVREKIRFKHYSYSTEKTYVHWIKHYIFFHNKKHPIDMGKREIEEYLTSLAIKNKVAPTTQNQAFSAILFLYKEVLGVDMSEWNIQALRAQERKHIPVVLTKDEVFKVLENLKGIYNLVTMLIYGCGLRMSEVLNLRVKDIDLGFDVCKLNKRVTSHTERSALGVQELLGHKSVETKFGFHHTFALATVVSAFSARHVVSEMNKPKLISPLDF